MSDQDQNSGVNVNAEGEVNIGGDVVGRDSITTTTTTTTHTQIAEGGPVARYAVLGVIGIAALAIIIMALIAFRNNPPPATPTSTPTAVVPPTPFPTLTLAPTLPVVAETPSTATATVVALPTSTATITPPPPSPATETPSLTPPATDTERPKPTSIPTTVATATDTPTEAPPPTPSPTSALIVYDDFNDHCLDADRWALIAGPIGLDTPTPTPIPAPGNCLQTQRQFFTEGEDGRLSVFLSLEGDETHSLVQKSGACYEEVEVVAALNDVQIFDAGSHTSYLSIGLSLSRASGDGFLEVRVEGGNTSGRLAPQVTSRLTIPTGYQNFGPLPYAFHQPITIAFRVKDVGKTIGNAGVTSESKKVTAYVDDQPITPPFSILAAPCGLTLGYHADMQTLLDGYFDEARFSLAP